MKKYDVEHTQSSLTEEILKDFQTSFFFETGTNIGSGIKIAKTFSYKKIFSVDIEEHYVVEARKKFKEDDRIQIFHGDSREILKRECPKISEKTTFYLDGHYFFDIPLVEELEAISTSPFKEHVILIDDCRMLDTDSWSFTERKKIVEMIKKINNEYQISYRNTINGINDLMVAEIKNG